MLLSWFNPCQREKKEEERLQGGANNYYQRVVFPKLCCRICLMSAQGDMRGSGEQKHKPRVDISLVLLQTLCIFWNAGLIHSILPANDTADVTQRVNNSQRSALYEEPVNIWCCSSKKSSLEGFFLLFFLHLQERLKTGPVKATFNCMTRPIPNLTSSLQLRVWKV